MKIVVTAEKSGQVLAKSEFDAGKPADPAREVRRALKTFHKEHPEVSLFDDDIRFKFDKAE
ncbi:MAG: hypothetical protein ACXWDA_06345 [Aeromicrobium sp.]|jgi:hypothetical protein